MQQSISRRDVYEPGMTARVAGRDLEVSQVQVDRSLPDPVTGGSLTAASASFTAVEGDAVTDRVATPWDPSTSWPPVPQAEASVSMNTGNGPASLMANGRVISASGGTGGREVEVEVADAYESLNRTISWSEFAAAVPSLREAEVSRYVGLNSCGLTDRILRHCGWYATPPPIEAQVVSVPGNGTMWPEKGIVSSSSRRSVPEGTAGYPVWLNAPWGVGVSDVSASYMPSTSFTLDERSGRVEITAMAGRVGTGGSMAIDLVTEAYSHIRVSFSDAWIYLWATDTSGDLATIVRVPRVEGFIYATVDYVSAGTIHGVLRAGGESASATFSCEDTVTNSPLMSVDIFGGVTSGAGFQVAYPWAKDSLIGWEPNAVLYPRGGNRNTLTAVPPVEGENCADLLRQQCEAECGTYWIDEGGVLRWWDLERLEARPSVATLNSDDDIAESGFTWGHDLSQVKSRASVKWRETLREWSWRTSIDLWQGSGSTVSPVDEPKEQWINVPDDQIWLMVDDNMRMVTDALNGFNYGWFSHYGGVSASTGEWTYSLRASLERVTGNAYKLTTWSTSGLSAEAVQSTPSERLSSALWMARRSMDLPIIRGKARFTLIDRVIYSAQSGPQTAPEHTIDAGWWIQSEEQAQYTADYYGARLTVPQPVLSSIALIPVVGLQLGDVVEVHDSAVTGLLIRGLVVDDSRSIDADMSVSHAVAVRPTHIARPGLTWQEWGEYMAGRSWETWGSEQQPKTWEQWGANPLDGEVL